MQCFKFCVKVETINILCTALFQVYIKCDHTIFKVFEILHLCYVIDASSCFVLTVIMLQGGLFSNWGPFFKWGISKITTN